MKTFNEKFSDVYELLQANKTSNYSEGALKLLAYCLCLYVGRNVIEIPSRNNWLSRHLENGTLEKAINFLKTKDFFYRIKENEYRLNLSSLSGIIAEEISLDTILKVRDLEKKEHKKQLTTLEFLGEQKEKKELKELKRKLSLSQSKNKRKFETLRKDSTQTYGEYRFNPSENPKLQSWRERETSEWRLIDFLGYYIFCFKRTFGFENTSLQNDQAYLKAKLKIRAGLVFWFRNNRTILKQYIAFAVKRCERKNAPMPYLHIIFNTFVVHPWLLDEFRRNQKTRKANDRSWAESSTWNAEKE